MNQTNRTSRHKDVFAALLASGAALAAAGALAGCSASPSATVFASSKGQYYQGRTTPRAQRGRNARPTPPPQSPPRP